MPAAAFRDQHPATHQQPARSSGSTPGTTACTCGGRNTPLPAAGVQIRPVQVTIGIIISAAALFGFTNTPGQLADRSALIPADTIRDLADQPGTLFHRLLTDDSGNLLDVTELSRFPSRKSPWPSATVTASATPTPATCPPPAATSTTSSPSPKDPPPPATSRLAAETTTGPRHMPDTRPNTSSTAIHVVTRAECRGVLNKGPNGALRGCPRPPTGGMTTR